MTKKFKEYCEECGCPLDICCGKRIRKEMLEKIEEILIENDLNICFRKLGKLRSFLQEEEKQGGGKKK